MPFLRRYPRDFVLITVANFLFFLNFASFFLLPLYVKQLGGTEKVVGQIMGVQALAGLAVLPLLATFIDRVGRRRVLLPATLAMTAVSIGFAFVDRLSVWIYVWRILQGFSFSFAFTTASTLAIELAPPERRGAAIGLFGVSTLLTHAIAPALGEQIALRFGFQTLFLVAAGYGLLGTLLTLWVREIRPDRSAGSGASNHGRLEQGVWPMALVTLAAGMGFGSVVTFSPTFTRSVGISRVGPFFLAYTVAAVLIRLAAGGMSDRYGRTRVLLPALVGLAVSVGSLGFVRDLLPLLAVGLMFGTAQGVVYPTLNACMADLATPAVLGRVQALFNGAFTGGVALSAFVFGIAVERWGYPVMFSLSASVVLLGAAALVQITRGATDSRSAAQPPRRPPPPPPPPGP